MKHLDWLDPDNIILQNNTQCGKEFTKDMKSKKFDNLRLLEVEDKWKTQNYIRYSLDHEIKWFHCVIVYRKIDDYFLRIDKMIEFKELEENFIKWNRDDILSKIIK